MSGGSEDGEDSVRAELDRILDRADVLALHEREHDTSERLCVEVVPGVVQLLDDAIAVCSRILDLHDHPDHSSPPGGGVGEDFLRVVDRLMQDDTEGHLCDLAFMGRMELVARRARLRQIGVRTPPWGILATATSAKRRVVKAISALAHSIRVNGADESALDRRFVSELTHALRTRRLYAKFRRSLGDDPIEATTVVRRLRLAAVQLAVLVGDPVYEHLRIMDRMEFRRFQRAILGWLRAEVPDALSGRRLWQDLTAFAALLAQINRRAEILQHDLAVLEEILRSPPEGAGRTVAMDVSVFRDQARHLYGRDDELDALIEGRRLGGPERWLERLHAMHDEVRATAAFGVPTAVPKDVTDAIIALHGGAPHGEL